VPEAERRHDDGGCISPNYVDSRGVVWCKFRRCCACARRPVAVGRCKFGLYGEEGAAPGGFVLRARTSQGYKALQGFIDGRLLWDGSSVLTSAGGTMSGAASLSFPSGSLVYGNDARVSRWIAGGDISKGPRIDLHGADFDTQPGIINFIARNSAASSQMILNPSQGLILKDSPVLTAANGLLFPNFSSYTDIAISTSDVTMPFSGWLCSPSNVSSTAPTLTVNGVNVMTFGGSSTSGTAVAVPVKKGDTVRISAGSYTFRLFSLTI